MPLEHALQTRGTFPDPGPWKQHPHRPVSLTAPLGVDAFARQARTRARRAPYQLNVMVVGETGLGKSTFMNTLFNTDLHEQHPKVPQDTKTVAITPLHFELEEEGVKLHLCLIDTPGFGDRLNREEDVQPILEYIDAQYDAYYETERTASFRRQINDTRVHMCLYFIQPTGHHLKELDIVTLKELSTKLNVIPVIAKADTLTREERTTFKEAILQDLHEHNISIYPTAYPDDRDPYDSIEKHIPFAVMGSNEFVTSKKSNKLVRGREYRWGIVEVDDPDHCDVVYLRSLLVEECMHELKELTHGHHYHEHRARILRGHGRADSLLECDEEYDTRVTKVKERTLAEFKDKEENMRNDFVGMVKDTEDGLRQREQELQRKRDEMMSELENQQQQIAQLEKELTQKLSLRQ